MAPRLARTKSPPHSELTDDLLWIQGCIDDATERSKSAAPFGWACKYTQHEVTSLLRSFFASGMREIPMLQTVETQVTDRLVDLRKAHDTNLMQNFAIGNDAPSPVEAIYAAWASAFGVVDRFNAVIDQHQAFIAELSDVETRRAEYVASGNSVSDRDIQRCDGVEFELLIGDLLRRDGLTILRSGGGPRDHGADLIAVTPDGRRVVIQCKLRQSKPVSPEVVYQVNGTARPHHNADIPVIVTNSTFSAQASAFARQHDIYLLGEYKLRRWATWGEDIYHVLELTKPHSDTGPATEAA
ncbi:restriction endonuclease [Nocardia sp. CA-084685]|uniref:restriction endonuclease n=1 Tax=Nocardia sp. CA-084685 TaxID=3239970 RepID=UPI003D994E36